MPAFRKPYPWTRTDQSLGPHGPNHPETKPPAFRLPPLLYYHSESQTHSHHQREISARQRPVRLPPIHHFIPELRELRWPGHQALTSGNEVLYRPAVGGPEHGPATADFQNDPDNFYSPHDLEHRPSHSPQHPPSRYRATSPSFRFTGSRVEPPAAGGTIEQEPTKDAWHPGESPLQPRHCVVTSEDYSLHNTSRGGDTNAQYHSRRDSEPRKFVYDDRLSSGTYMLTAHRLRMLPWDQLVKFARSRGAISEDIIVDRLCQIYGDEIPISFDDHISLSIFEDPKVEIDLHTPTPSPQLQGEFNNLVTPAQQETLNYMVAPEQEEVIAEGKSHDLEGSHAARQAARISLRQERNRSPNYADASIRNHHQHDRSEQQRPSAASSHDGRADNRKGLPGSGCGYRRGSNERRIKSAGHRHPGFRISTNVSCRVEPRSYSDPGCSR